MASNGNMGFKRTLPKTHAAFKTLPTLRGKDNKNTEKTLAEKKFKRPPQFADQLLFPGRRLDRRQHSTISGYSGRSLDIETIISGGRPETSSIVGSGPPGLLASAGFTRSLDDVNEQPWDMVRQLPSAHSQMNLASRNGHGFGPNLIRGKGLLNSFPGASASMGNLCNLQNSAAAVAGGVPVASSKWKRSDYDTFYDSQNNINKVLNDISSPDSSYSSESMSESASPSPQPQMPPPPVPRVQLHRNNSNASSTQNKRPKYLKNASRKQSEKSGASPTPQLDKILWALVPDEFANISDTGVSDMEHGSHHDSASSRYVTFTDLEAGNSGLTSRVPNTPRRPILTQETLSQHTGSMSSDDRIMQWLADCDAQSTTTNLPTHLPDISYTFKYVRSTS